MTTSILIAFEIRQW